MEALFGTVTLEIIAKADAPVLAIPANATFRGIDNIAYTTNFEFRDLGPINFLKKLVEVFDATLHCLHVIEGREKDGRAAKNMSILKEIYKGEERLLFDMVEGGFRERIERFARSKQADIVATMLRKRSFISRIMQESAVQGLAHRMNLPLLVLKDQASATEAEIRAWLTV